jgi:hypothetical protein
LWTNISATSINPLPRTRTATRALFAYKSSVQNLKPVALMVTAGSASPFMAMTIQKPLFPCIFHPAGTVAVKKGSYSSSGLSTGMIFAYTHKQRSSFHSALGRKKEGRKRNLHFHLPAAISCSPNLRLLQNDSSYITLGDIYDRYCEDTDITREDPILMAGEKVKKVLREFKQSSGKTVSSSPSRELAFI